MSMNDLNYLHTFLLDKRGLTGVLLLTGSIEMKQWKRSDFRYFLSFLWLEVEWFSYFWFQWLLQSSVSCPTVNSPIERYTKLSILITKDISIHRNNENNIFGPSFPSFVSFPFFPYISSSSSIFLHRFRLKWTADDLWHQKKHPILCFSLPAILTSNCIHDDDVQSSVTWSLLLLSHVYLSSLFSSWIWSVQVCLYQKVILFISSSEVGGMKKIETSEWISPPISKSAQILLFYFQIHEPQLISLLLGWS